MYGELPSNSIVLIPTTLKPIAGGVCTSVTREVSSSDLIYREMPECTITLRGMWKLISTGDEKCFISKMSAIQKWTNECMMLGNRDSSERDSKSPSNSQRGFTQKEGVKSKSSVYVLR